jgi:hypothetical protein
MSDKDKKNATSFQPGQSGNPGGRSPKVGPNGETITQLCRAKTAKLIERAYEIALSKTTDPKDALAAIFGLCDRGWGRPKESVDIDASVKGSGVPIIQIVRMPDADGAD